MDKLLFLLIPTALTFGMLFYVFKLSGRSLKDNWDYAKFVLDRSENGGYYPESWEEYDNELDIIERYGDDDEYERIN